MSHHHFEYLLNTVCDAFSSAAVGGNNPIYPEMVMAVGLCFFDVGDNVSGLTDVYGLSNVSCWRCINVFLDAIDDNEICPKLQVRLPDLKNAAELTDLSARWCAASTAHGLFRHNLGCLDSWLPFTVAPDVPNQADYY